ncbi:MAG: type secretion system protein [Pseudomonas sp.]|nr:type secretion system protein [Pseudomonas sp.]
MVLSYIHNMTNREKAISPAHGAIMITKYVDKSSPLLAQALDQREDIECTIDMYRTVGHEAQEKFYSIILKGAMIVDLTFDMPHVILQGHLEPQEHVYIRYREINWRHHLAATSGYAVWGQ